MPVHVVKPAAYKSEVEKYKRSVRDAKEVVTTAVEAQLVRIRRV